jgi:hypothetical protein
MCKVCLADKYTEPKRNATNRKIKPTTKHHYVMIANECKIHQGYNNV